MSSGTIQPRTGTVANTPPPEPLEKYSFQNTRSTGVVPPPAQPSQPATYQAPAAPQQPAPYQGYPGVGGYQQQPAPQQPPQPAMPEYAEEPADTYRKPMSPAPAARQPHVSPPSYAAPTPRPATPPPAPSRQPPAQGAQSASDEEDLDIPAFIRKKLM